MNCIQSFISISMICLTCGSSALADRAWEGHIHLVGSNIKMVFDGYDYGTWDDVGRLDFPARGRVSGGAWSVAFRITPDDDNPLQATIHGTVELVVDEQKAVIKELRFVRKHKYADWQIDPKIIDDLKNRTNRDQKDNGHSEHEANGQPATDQHNSPADSDASRDNTPPTLLDADFRNLSTLDALLTAAWLMSHRRNRYMRLEATNCGGGKGALTTLRSIGDEWEFKQTSLNGKGLFLNGRYEFGDDGYRAVFPIDDLDYSQFSFSIDFLPLDFDPERTGSSAWMGHLVGIPAGDSHTNLLVVGTSYRWFGIKVRDGHLWLTVNNGNLEYPYQHAVVSPREWHNVSGSIDLDDGVIRLMLDGDIVVTEKLPKDFAFTVASSPEVKDDRQITFTDYSNSETLYGYVARVTVLDGALDGRQLEDWYQSRFKYRSALPGLSRSEAFPVSIPTVLVILVAGGIICVVARKTCRNRASSHVRDSATMS
jgi:hypothetical protein